VEPDDLGDELGEVPGLGEAFSGEGVVDADDATFEVGDVAAGEGGHFDDAGEGFGHDGVEGDLADVVEETADEGVGGVEFRAGFLGEHFGGGGDGEGVFPEVLAFEEGGGGVRGFVGGVLEGFEDLDGEGEVADGFEAEEDDGLLDGSDGDADAGGGGAGEGKEFAGEGLVGGEELDDFLDAGVGGVGEGEEANDDGGEGGEGVKLLEDELDLAGFDVLVGGGLRHRGFKSLKDEIGMTKKGVQSRVF
jgi:hypothetical protein